MEYVGEDGQKHRPIMVHRVIFGSIERFIGILIEHYAGKFPVWLSPVQVKILPITERQEAYARKLYAEMKTQGIRAELDLRNEKIGYKIREGADGKGALYAGFSAKKRRRTASPPSVGGIRATWGPCLRTNLSL